MKNQKTTCKDCGVATTPGAGSARCPSCWDDKVGRDSHEIPTNNDPVLPEKDTNRESPPKAADASEFQKQYPKMNMHDLAEAVYKGIEQGIEEMRIRDYTFSLMREMVGRFYHEVNRLKLTPSESPPPHSLKVEVEVLKAKLSRALETAAAYVVWRPGDTNDPPPGALVVGLINVAREALNASPLNLTAESLNTKLLEPEAYRSSTYHEGSQERRLAERIEQFERENAELKKELEEQCRLHGMGASREHKLITINAELKDEIEELSRPSFVPLAELVQHNKRNNLKKNK